MGVRGELTLGFGGQLRDAGAGAFDSVRHSRESTGEQGACAFFATWEAWLTPRSWQTYTGLSEGDSNPEEVRVFLYSSWWIHSITPFHSTMIVYSLPYQGPLPRHFSHLSSRSSHLRHTAVRGREIPRQQNLQDVPDVPVQRSGPRHVRPRQLHLRRDRMRSLIYLPVVKRESGAVIKPIIVFSDS